MLGRSVGLLGRVFESYIRDLTHVRPLRGDAQHLLRVGRFSRRIGPKSPIAEAGRLQPVARPPSGTSPALIELADTFKTSAS